MDSDRIKINTRWGGTLKHKMLVLDTSAILNIVKGVGRADEALHHLLQTGWSLFCPTPAMLEIGLGPADQVDKSEENFWRTLRPASEVMNEMNRSYPVGFDLTPNAVQMWIQLRNAKIFEGKIHLLNIDTMNWMATKLSMTTLANKLHQGTAIQQKQKSLQRFFMDALIQATARNIFSGLWTDNPRDFLVINSCHSEVERADKAGRPTRFVPLFTTGDLVEFLDGGELRFPSDHLKKMVGNAELLSSLEPG